MYNIVRGLLFVALAAFLVGCNDDLGTDVSDETTLMGLESDSYDSEIEILAAKAADEVEEEAEFEATDEVLPPDIDEEEDVDVEVDREFVRIRDKKSHCNRCSHIKRRLYNADLSQRKVLKLIERVENALEKLETFRERFAKFCERLNERLENIDDEKKKARLKAYFAKKKAWIILRHKRYYKCLTEILEILEEKLAEFETDVNPVDEEPADSSDVEEAS